MKDTILVQKWSEDALSMGWVSFPSSLLFLQKSFGLSSNGLNVLLHLIMHWWNPNDDPYPSQETIAKRMGVSKRTVQRAMHELEENGLVEKRTTSRENPKYRGRNVYSLRPLATALEFETPKLKGKIKHYKDDSNIYGA